MRTMKKRRCSLIGIRKRVPRGREQELKRSGLSMKRNRLFQMAILETCLQLKAFQLHFSCHGHARVMGPILLIIVTVLNIK